MTSSKSKIYMYLESKSIFKKLAKVRTAREFKSIYWQNTFLFGFVCRKSSGVRINSGGCVCVCVPLWRQCWFTILFTTPCRPTDPKLIPFGLAWTVEIRCPDTSSSNKNGGVLRETVNRPHPPRLYQSRLQFIPRSLGNAILQCLNVNAIFD